MGFGLGAVVQSEDSHDDSVELAGNHDRAGAAAIGSAIGMVVFLERDAEGRVECWSTVPESQTLRRASLVCTTDRSCALANAVTLAISSGECAVVGGQLLMGQVAATFG